MQYLEMRVEVPVLFRLNYAVKLAFIAIYRKSFFANCPAVRWQTGYKFMNDPKQMLRDIEAEVALTRRCIGKDALDARVMAAMEAVPRHEFLPDDLRDIAYYNGPVPIGCGQTISQPYIVALMTDLIKTKPTDVVLEVGTGSGYQSAVLSQLVAKVYSVEIIETLAVNAKKRLAGLGYENVLVRNANGYFGWAEQGPFNGIMVTAAAPHVPPALLEQLAVGGRLVIPLGLPRGYQELVVMEKRAEHEFDSRVVLGVSFVPLTGIYNKNQV